MLTWAAVYLVKHVEGGIPGFVVVMAMVFDMFMVVGFAEGIGGCHP